MNRSNAKSFSALQIQTLGEMGIELWQQRENISPAASQQPELLHKQPEPAHKQPEPAHKQPEPVHKQPESVHTQLEPIKQPVELTNTPEAQMPAVPVEHLVFNLLCMRNKNLLLITDDGDTDGALGDQDKALLSSIVRVSDVKTKPELIGFKWPQLASSTGLDAAQKAFAVFSLHQVEQLTQPVMILFGNSAVKLLSDIGTEVSENNRDSVSEFNWHSIRCIRVPALEIVRAKWQLKRDLCYQINALSESVFLANSSPVDTRSAETKLSK